MFYKKALDLFGIKNILDVQNPSDLKQMFAPGVKIEGKYTKISDKVQVLGKLLQEAKQRRQKIKDTIPIEWDPWGSPKYDSSHFNFLQNKINIIPGQQHPAVIAHELGHSAQKIRPKLADLWRGSAKIRPAIAALIPNYIRLIRQRTNKEYDPSKLDTADILTGAGLGAANAAAAWKFGTDTIKNQLNASGRGMRYLRSAGMGKPVFSNRTLQESKKILRAALKTYKKARIVDTLMSAVTPLASYGFSTLLNRIGKKHKQEKDQKLDQTAMAK